MVPKRFTILVLTAAIAIILLSCQDIGTEIPFLEGLSASNTNVSIAKGTTIQITLSGGKQPYIIKKPPDIAKATVSLSSSILTIFGTDTGSTSTLITDNKTPFADSLEILIFIVGTLPLVSFSDQIQPIINNSQCTRCHGGSGGLTFSTSSSYTNLVNVNAQSSCTSLKRILPYDADNSVLYRKVAGITCGSQMPPGSVLSSSDINLIRDWINQGAKNN